MRLRQTLARLLRPRLALWFVVAAGLGCQSVFLKPPHWTVTLSPLDYVQFMTGKESRLGRGMILQRVELLGTGYLTFLSGRSPRVANDFWTERQTEQWDEFHQDAVPVSGMYTLGCFQHLVDSGFFEDNRFTLKRDAATTNGIFVVASLNGRTKAAMTSDPQIEVILRELMKQF
ncbi:MAG: hypothetical protein K8T26_15880 [Lentisphaerae bacterium]|nr:hypothetical protein [Lentisphaerota bacterium]